MRKNFTIILILTSLFICLTIISDISAQTNSEDEVIESVTLDKTRATLACFGAISKNIGYCNEEARKIRISTISKAAEKNDWVYYYFPSGGKIIGEGANVIWDFSYAKPGEYSITIGVGKDKVLKGSFITKAVTVESCECFPPCSCPAISISSSTAPAKRGETLIFTAHLSGGTQDRSVFNWRVLGGEVIKTIQENGESQILVKTSKKSKAKQITATVEVNGLCADCTQRTASATIKIK